MTTNITLNEFKSILEYTIDNNKQLELQGEHPIALNLVGEKGIGKTSIIEQVAQEKQMGFTKLNLAMLDEVGDLVGYPIKEYEAQLFKYEKQQDGTSKLIPLKTIWGAEQLFKQTNQSLYRYTGRTRMGYAKPSWVPSYNENGNIVLLDDYSRATPIFINALMDLIKDQKYISWSLPKNTTIVLTTNPDNGSYNVSSMDDAQTGRMLNFYAKFNLDDWSYWAESKGIDGRIINFALSYGKELFSQNENGDSIADARSYTMFANMLKGISDWDNEKNLSFIYNIGNGCFNDTKGKVSAMFTTFIRNKMHLLPQPQQMLEDDWNKTRTILEKTVYDKDGTYRTDIASILERRFSNYVNIWFDTKKEHPIKIVKDRIVNFIKNEETSRKLFTEDMFYHMIKTITSQHTTQTQKLLYDPDIAKKIL